MRELSLPVCVQKITSCSFRGLKKDTSLFFRLKLNMDSTAGLRYWLVSLDLNLGVVNKRLRLRHSGTNPPHHS